MNAKKKLGDLGAVLFVAFVAFGIVSCAIMSAGLFAYSICLIFSEVFGL